MLTLQLEVAERVERCVATAAVELADVVTTNRHQRRMVEAVVAVPFVLCYFAVKVYMQQNDE